MIEVESGLFIGGPADGKLISVEKGRDYYNIAQMEGPVFSMPTPGEPHLPPPVTNVTYTRRGLPGETVQYSFWALESMSDDEAFRQLLGGYKGRGRK